MRLDLLADQMTFCDLDLFVFRVAGQPDDFHAVQQRLRHPQRIGCRHEHHIRQVVIDFEIMIGECSVLFGVEDLQQRRCRIAAPVRAQLVDLIEQEQRIGGFRLLHALDDLARHRTDIGPPVTADFGLVAHAAKRHTNEAPARCLRHRLAERCLADAGRADKAEDRSLHLPHAGLDGQVFKNALLDLLKPVMIRIENLFRRLDVFLYP